MDATTTDDRALDNPVWSSLAAWPADRVRGEGLARRFAPEVGPFCAIEEPTTRAWAALGELVADHGLAALLSTGARPAVDDVKVEALGEIVQMLAPSSSAQTGPRDDLIPLGPADAPEMRTLAELTKPGPFGPRTHELGSFVGLRREGKLVAMAGERMNFGHWREVSAVCVHPDHRGAGHAVLMMNAVADAIRARGEQPFLHVFRHNSNAIALYERLGWTARRSFDLYRLDRV